MYVCGRQIIANKFKIQVRLPPPQKKIFQGIVLTSLLDLTPAGSAERKGICPGTVVYPTPAGYYLVYLTL